ncbi:MAG: TIGR02646 family protein [Bacteroidaceae bacterium]|nr:TIGR02646 family protein [Bacteroidaceae bacterium]
MIKITKSPNAPASLLNAPVPASAAEVRKEIYKADDVRQQLETDQHYKCAFCECYLPLQYHDVEHFRPKSHYYWLGHEWKNLLYSCERCNRSYKKTNFPLSADSVQANSPTDDITLEHPLLINPAEIDPALHIRFDKHKAIGITPEGKKTIEVFHLNDQNECPELIDNRKQLFELYQIENDKIRLTEQILQIPNLPQVAINLANQAILKSRESIRNLTSLNKPFSGMLISQIQ